MITLKGYVVQREVTGFVVDPTAERGRGRVAVKRDVGQGGAAETIVHSTSMEGSISVENDIGQHRVGGVIVVHAAARAPEGEEGLIPGEINVGERGAAIVQQPAAEVIARVAAESDVDQCGSVV